MEAPSRARRWCRHQRADGGGAVVGRRPSAAGAAGADAERGAVGRRRLLQHAPGGRPHAPVAGPLLPTRRRGPRLRGAGHRQRLRLPTSASARSSSSSFGPEFRLLELDGDPQPSPTAALNAGIAAARGEALAPDDRRRARADPRRPALRDEGAPHLRAGGRGHAAVVRRDRASRATPSRRATTSASRTGSSTSIDWPVDGYRLFEIGHFIGERDWFDGIVESNCLFVPRKLLEQVGGFDESFSMPGGGYANLDLFERLAQSPGVTPASILGEGTFHQFHGGTTTNVADEAARRERVVSYRRALRGAARPAARRRSTGPLHYVGAMAARAARRTRSRRWPTLAFDALREPTDMAAPPAPVPDELKLAAIESVWDHQAWREATWLGHPVNRYPADLHVYQELLARVRPSLVVVAGDDARPRRARAVRRVGLRAARAMGGSSPWAVATCPSGPATRASPTCRERRRAPRSPRQVAALAPGAARRAGDPRPRRRSTGWSLPSSATPRWSRSAATSWWRTPWSTGGRPGRASARDRTRRSSPSSGARRLRARPERRAVHGDVQPRRLPEAGPGVTAATAALVLRAHAEDGGYGAAPAAPHQFARGGDLPDGGRQLGPLRHPAPRPAAPAVRRARRQDPRDHRPLPPLHHRAARASRS